MSEKCQERTHAPQQTTRSLDYRIGHSEQLVRHSEAERLGRLQIDYQLVFGRGLHRQVGRFLALKDSADTPKARVMELA
jgi:hypothetical protein